MYPTLNPGGLTANTQSLPGDGQDLNRMFPGKPRGSAAGGTLIASGKTSRHESRMHSLISTPMWRVQYLMPSSTVWSECQPSAADERVCTSGQRERAHRSGGISEG